MACVISRMYQYRWKSMNARDSTWATNGTWASGVQVTKGSSQTMTDAPMNVRTMLARQVERRTRLPVAAFEGEAARRGRRRRGQQRPYERDGDIPGEQLRPALGTAHGGGIDVGAGGAEKCQDRPQHESDCPDPYPPLQKPRSRADRDRLQRRRCPLENPNPRSCRNT